MYYKGIIVQILIKYKFNIKLNEMSLYKNLSDKLKESINYF